MQTMSKAHWGGHLGLVGLTAMLLFTSCVAITEKTYEGGVAWFPAWAQKDAAQNVDNTAEMAAYAKQEVSSDAQFIVRFENEPLLNDVGKTFRRDPKAARASYRRWQAQNPAMEGIELVRASYSGELILALPSNDVQQRSAQDVLEALEAMDNLVYAELDATAKPSQ